MISVLLDFPIGLLRYATENLQDPTGNIESRIISISPLTRAVRSDKTFEISSMTIEFSDHDNFFRNMMASENRYIAQRLVEVYYGSKVVFEGYVSRWSYAEDTFEIEITDPISQLSKIYPENSINKIDYPNAPTENLGYPIYILYGSFFKTGKGAVRVPRVSDYQYLIADHPCRSISEAFTESGDPVSGWTLENTGGRCYITFTVAQTENFLCVNGEGKQVGTGDNDNPMWILYDFFGEEIKYNADAFNSCLELITSRNYKAAIQIVKEQPLNEILSHFCTSFDCSYSITRSEICFRMFDFADLEPAARFTEANLFDFGLKEDPGTVLSRVKYMYQYITNGDFYNFLPSFEPASAWPENYDTLALRYAADYETAFDVVQRFAIQKKNPERTATFSIPLVELGNLDLLDIISVDHPAAITNPRLYQILRVNIDFLSDTVQVEAIDISVLAGEVFILGNRDILPGNITEASENDKVFGYLDNKVLY